MTSSHSFRATISRGFLFLFLLGGSGLGAWSAWAQQPQRSADAKKTPAKKVAAKKAATNSSQEASGAESADRTLQPGDIYLDGSRVFVHVGKVGLGHEHAVVGQLISGHLRLDAAENAGELLFDMKSFVADTEEARTFIGLEGTTDEDTQQKVNANMLGSAVLDVQRYPTAKFVVKKVTRLSKPSGRGKPQLQLDGEFTLHKVTRPIQVVAEADSEDQEGWIRLRGKFSILQSSYGIKPFSKAFGAIGVADELTIHGDLWVARRAARL